MSDPDHPATLERWQAGLELELAETLRLMARAATEILTAAALTPYARTLAGELAEAIERRADLVLELSGLAEATPAWHAAAELAERLRLAALAGNLAELRHLAGEALP